MFNFIYNQIDYANFCHSIFLFFFAFACYSTAKKKVAGIKWHILALFAFIKGFSETFSIYAYFADPNIVISFFDVLFDYIAYLTLFEFARQSFNSLQNKPDIIFKKLIKILYLPVAVLPLLFSWFYRDYFYIYINIFLAVPAAVFLYYLFSIFSKENPVYEKWFKRVAVFMCIYITVDTLTNFTVFFNLPLSGFFRDIFCSIAVSFPAILLFDLDRYYFVDRNRNDLTSSVPFSRLKHMIFLLAFVVLFGFIFAKAATRLSEKTLYKDAGEEITVLSDIVMSEIQAADKLSYAVSISYEINEMFAGLSKKSIEKTNIRLKKIAGVIPGTVCYVLNKDGIVLASSNYDLKDSFVNENLSFRSYFKDAVKGGTGGYFVKGNTSRRNGYFSSVSIKNGNNQVIGVAVVKLDLGFLQGRIKKPGLKFFLISPEDIIFMASDEKYALRPLYPISGALKKQLEESESFGTSLGDPVFYDPVIQRQFIFFNGEKYIKTGKGEIGIEGWSVLLLSDYSNVVYARIFALIIVFFAAVLSLMLFFIRQQNKFVKQVNLQRKAVIDSASSFAIISLDNNGEIVIFSKGAQKIFKYKKHDALFKSAVFLFDNDDLDALLRQFDFAKDKSSAFKEFLKSVGQSDDLHKHELKFKTQYDDIIYGELTITPQKYDNGFLLVIEDISERKKFLSQIKQQLYFLQVLMDSIPNPVFFKDKTFHYVGCNKAFEDFTGFPKEKIIGSTADTVLPLYSSVILSNDSEAFNNPGKIVKNNLEFILKDSKKHNIMLLKSTFNDINGQLDGIVGVVIDITELSEIQEQRNLLQQKLFQQNKIASIGYLAGGLAHEINNPMSVISNYAKLIQMLPYYAGDEKIKRSVDNITVAVKRTKEIIQDLLEFARAENIKFNPVNFNMLIEKVFASFLRQFEENSIAVTKSLDSSVKIISGSEIQLKQMLINIILNSIDAIKEAKRAAGEITVKTYKDNGFVILEVKDNGIGIKEADITKVFDPFYTTKDVGGGTGFGLSTCYSIVQAHKGSIEVKSIHGFETTVIIKFSVA